MSSTLKVAVVQPVPVDNDPADRRNPEKAVKLLDQAAVYEPDLVVFPEYFPFHETRDLVEAVRDLGAFVVAGIAYREGGSLYNTATIYSPRGEVLARQRKRFIGRLESRLWGFQAWNGPYTVVDIGKARLGVAVCADFWSFPESSLELFLAGADVFVNPSYMFSLQGHWIKANLSRALDFFTPVIGADLAAYPFRTKRYVFHGGGSSHVIVPPSDMEEYGEWWASGAVDASGWIRVKLSEKEGIAYYEIDVTGVNQVRRDWWKRLRGSSLEEWLARARSRHASAKLLKYM
ncbi:MAG: carbon-nitrogen hydrolase family protein [Desulfurococcales archaeon]|nr:carbon-nitrogen hydrolase family protein [Desulfurococcales archaeon]